MTNKLATSLALVTGILIVSLTALAHHGGSQFDTKNPVILKGAVKEFYWENPHCQVFLDVTDEKGDVVEWTLEALSPSSMSRAGWSRTVLKPGDKVTITVAPSKKGTHTGAVRGVTLADGRVLNPGHLGEQPDNPSEGQY